ncbi:RING-type E3 ubiquitin transferase, partial [Caerostris extrusa]
YTRIAAVGNKPCCQDLKKKKNIVVRLGLELLEGIKNNVKRIGSNTDITPRSAESSGQQQIPPHPQLPQPLGSLPHELQVQQICEWCLKNSDLTFKKGDVIILRKKEWIKIGFMVSLEENRVLCLLVLFKLLYLYLLMCHSNWNFPISFVEMNAAARAVMKLSSNAQLSSRILPPVAPTTDSHFGNTATTSVSSAAQSPSYQESSNNPTMQQAISSGSNTSFSPSAFTSPIHNSSVPSQQNVSMAAYPGTSYDGQHHPGNLSHHRQSQPSVGPKSNSEDQQTSNEGVHDNSVVSKSRSTPSPAFSSVASVTPPLVSQRAESIGAQTPTQDNQEDGSVFLLHFHLQILQK